jgi:preprotein translocase subunit SecB
MEKATFQIIDYQFNQVHIDHQNYRETDFDISFEANGLFNSKDAIYQLQFSVTVLNKDAQAPYVQIACTGYYKFDNVATIQEIPEYFYKNSIAILFPYVRAYLSLVTTQSNLKGILLPTLNLSDLNGTLKMNTRSL